MMLETLTFWEVLFIFIVISTTDAAIGWGTLSLFKLLSKLFFPMLTHHHKVSQSIVVDLLV